MQRLDEYIYVCETNKYEINRSFNLHSPSRLRAFLVRCFTQIKSMDCDFINDPIGTKMYISSIPTHKDNTSMILSFTMRK